MLDHFSQNKYWQGKVGEVEKGRGFGLYPFLRAFDGMNESRLPFRHCSKYQFDFLDYSMKCFRLIFYLCVKASLLKEQE